MMSERTEQLLSGLRSLVEPERLQRYPSEFPKEKYLSWPVVDFDRIRRENTGTSLIRNSSYPYIKWCEENCSSIFVVDGRKIYFRSAEDCAHFAVVWM